MHMIFKSNSIDNRLPKIVKSVSRKLIRLRHAVTNSDAFEKIGISVNAYRNDKVILTKEFLETVKTRWK